MFLKALMLQNYRGIGVDEVIMPNFKKFNFFIGANNSGKSTVLNFISRHLPIPNFDHAKGAANLDLLERHSAASTNIMMAMGADIAQVKLCLQSNRPLDANASNALNELLNSIADENGLIWVERQLPYINESRLRTNKQSEAIRDILNHEQWSWLWSQLTGSGSGDIMVHWIPDTLSRIKNAATYTLPTTRLIPAIRQIQDSNGQDDYSGMGLINKLATIQSPDFNHREDKKLFDKINYFLQAVTDAPEAVIEIPHTRAHVLVHMGGKVLPLSSLGTGIHEVVMIAAFCTLSSKEILCIEEPEIHLHPLLQRKLISYLSDNTDNQYFIATHSPSFIDTPGSAIFHVKADWGQTRITEAVLRSQRHEICVDLGHRASDIVQSNAIIWVEGPSDRIYLKHWIRSIDATLIEQIHYSIMFYGGRLLSHLSADDEEITEFIELRSLNRNLAIIIDSDKTSARSSINPTKTRIINEFGVDNSIAWVTKGREIENYIGHSVLQSSVAATSPSYAKPLGGGQFDHALNYERLDAKRTRTKPTSADLAETNVDKIKVSRHVVAHNAADLDVLDLRQRVNEIVAMILKANA